jgi:multidrug resistance efflux pump
MLGPIKRLFGKTHSGNAGRQAKIKPVSSRNVYLKKEQFSAAAEHFMKRPAGFVLKGPIFVIFLLIFAAIVYSFFAEVQTKVTVPVVVSGEKYIVQSPVVGSISSIYVSNGEKVNEQTPMISILSEGILITESNINEIISEIEIMEKRFRLITTAIKKIEETADRYGRKNPVFRVNIAREVDFEFSEGIIEKSNVGVSKEKWEQSEYYNIVERIRISLKDLSEEYYRTKELLAKQRQIYAEDRKLFEKDVITEYQLANSHEKYLNLKASLANILNRFKVEIYNTMENLLEQRSQLYDRYNTIKLQLEESQITEENIIVRDKLVIINAKYPGEVVNVTANSYEYIGRGTPLMMIIRSDLPKFGVLYIPDGDMGKVSPGQTVTIKFEAYPYQEYGVQTGRIVTISPDPETAGGQIRYKSKMAFDVVNPKIDLKYGISGIAEINTGSKRLIETIFMPITKVFEYFEGADS